MEKAILMSTSMVQAILDGRKTQTRRIVKPSLGLQRTWLTQEEISQVPHGEIINGGWQMHHPKAEQYQCGVYVNYDSPYGWIKCPYGQIGDVLWVRETWSKTDSGHIIYKATNKGFNPIWKPSIFMPKEACRIRLEITNIRVERLQDISGEDAIMEGIKYTDPESGVPKPYLHEFKDYKHNDFECDALGSYRSLWEKINGKDSWKLNPWVWVIEFQKTK